MNFYSNGKLLISAEYLVMNGAKALALPTKYGQSLSVFSTNKKAPIIYWKSLNNHGNIWLDCTINYHTMQLISLNIGEKSIALKLIEILNEAKKINHQFLTKNISFNVETKLEFDRTWGLGSSSTLINNIAQWAKVNPFELQFTCFGGSGYDIACAKENNPIIYQLTKENNPIIKQAVFNPNFKDQIYFVHLNKKQNSRDAIKNYKKKSFNIENTIIKIDDITQKMIFCNNLKHFNQLILEHEQILSNVLNQPTVKEKYFKDYDLGEIKSLGAWGGDFILITGNSKSINYFKSKGFSTIISYSKMI